VLSRQIAAAPASLKEAYGDMFDVGVAIPSAMLSEAERLTLCTNFTAITPENSMKADSIHPEEGRYDFAEADEVTKLAERNKLKVNGHVLVWHSQCPDWFFADAGKPAGRDLVLKRMREHINAVVTHFRGKVFSWDVVNEAIADDQAYLRDSKWLSSIGEDFIEEAFVAAHALAAERTKSGSAEDEGDVGLGGVCESLKFQGQERKCDMIFAEASPAAQVIFWAGFAVIGIGYQVWRMWMQTCHTDDWLRLQQAEEEKKKKRDERIKNAIDEASALAKILLKK
jgi:hypothetical protein